MLLLVFWTSVMIVADFVVVQNSVRQALSVNFASTTGRVVKSEVFKNAISHRGVDIGYNYKVNGVEYSGQRYRYDDRSAAWEYGAAVDNFPRWSERKVYYNPTDPSDSLLDPGLAGCDLLLPLFATPLNVVTWALWVPILQTRRMRQRADFAGGVRILKSANETRAQLAAFSPGAVALGALAASSFVLAFPVVSIGGFQPGMALMLVVWALVFAAMVAAGSWRFAKLSAGNYDLRIDETSKVVTVPPSGERKAEFAIALNKIEAVSVRRRTTKTPSGDYFSYSPVIDCIEEDSALPQVNLISWGWTEAKANSFGLWLSEQLGVEFRGIQLDTTP
jgi:hypothetical protein